MVTLYTATGQYRLRRCANGQKIPLVIQDGKEHQLTVAEMVLWTKAMWNIYSQDLLQVAFAKEEKILGSMNFDFILNRLINRGLLISGTGEKDLEALHDLLDKLIVIPADISWLAQIKTFLMMVLFLKIPPAQAKAVFRKVHLDDNQIAVIKMTSKKPITVAEVTDSLAMKSVESLLLISNLYLHKIIRFTQKK